MKTRSRTHLALLAFGYSVFSACGQIEASEYRASSEAKSNKPNAQKSPVKKNPGSLNPGSTNPSGGVDSANQEPNSVSTGLTGCVRQAFESKQIPTWKLQPLSKTLAEFKTQASDGQLTNNDLWPLWDTFLRTLVDAESGLVNYKRLRDTNDLRGLWDSFVQLLAQTGLPQQGRSQQLAFWTNAYNILMIDILVKNPKALTPEFQSSKNPESTFSKKAHTVSNLSLTLNQIEYGVLKLGGGKTTHPVPANAGPASPETRLHMALVCGAVSCPKLRNFAYTEENLETVLNENVHMFFNNETDHVKPFVNGQPTQFSELFSWFSVDFDVLGGGQSPKSSGQFVLNQCRKDAQDVATFFASLSSFSPSKEPKMNGKFVNYNWEPNELK
jgi:hypothetical protein